MLAVGAAEGLVLSIVTFASLAASGENWRPSIVAFAYTYTAVSGAIAAALAGLAPWLLAAYGTHRYESIRQRTRAAVVARVGGGLIVGFALLMLNGGGWSLEYVVSVLAWILLGAVLDVARRDQGR